MSEVILCQVPRAKQPFYAEDIDLKLYSIEELCYFMQGHLALLSPDFFSPAMTDWLGGELHLHRLAETLEKQRAGGAGLENLILPVFQEIGWLSPAGKNTLSEKIRAMEALPEEVRMKQKGDVLAGYEKYTRAVRCYQKALKLSEGGEHSTGGQFRGTVYYNAGAVFARLFQMEEACECMKKAFDLLQSSAARNGYLFCVRLKDGEKVFLQKCRELGTEEADREEMERQIRSLPEPSVPKDVDAALNRWVREYHRQTDL